jgi:rhomboid protease GluP
MAAKRKRRSDDTVLGGLRLMLWPRKDYYVIPALFFVNVLVFSLMAFQSKSLESFSAEQVIRWGAIYPPLVNDGQWFRLVSGIFIHGGIRHLAMNLYGLLFAGVMIEFVLRPLKTAAVYFAAGIGSSIASIILHPASVSVGASGAIFGLWGYLLGQNDHREFPSWCRDAAGSEFCGLGWVESADRCEETRN